MKNKHFVFVLAFLMFLIACDKKQESVGVSNSEKPSVSAESTQSNENIISTEEKPAKKVSVPENLVTEGLTALGYPFEHNITYSITGTRDGEMEDTREVRVAKTESDKVILESQWKGVMTMQMGGEKYESNKDGIFITHIGDKELPEKPMLLPARLTPGKSWKVSYSIEPLGLEKINVQGTAKVVGKKKVTTELGIHDAWLVEEKSKMTGPTADMTFETQVYYVDGIGTVKIEIKQKGKFQGQDVNQHVTIQAVKK